MQSLWWPKSFASTVSLTYTETIVQGNQVPCPFILHRLICSIQYKATFQKHFLTLKNSAGESFWLYIIWWCIHLITSYSKIKSTFLLVMMTQPFFQAFASFAYCPFQILSLLIPEDGVKVSLCYCSQLQTHIDSTREQLFGNEHRILA